MKTFIRLTILTLLFAVPALGQEKKGHVQILVGYLNSEIKNPIEAVQNVRTLSIDGKINLINRSGFTFGPAFNYQRQYDVEVVMDSAIYPNGIYRDIDTYFGGVELAKKAGPFRFGGGFFLGARKDFLTMEYGRVRKYRGFVDLPLGPFVIRPFVVETEVAGGFNANRITRYGAGAGFRF